MTVRVAPVPNLEARTPAARRIGEVAVRWTI